MTTLELEESVKKLPMAVMSILETKELEILQYRQLIDHIESELKERGARAIQDVLYDISIAKVWE